MITKADKGKTIVIIDNIEYNKKTLEFINNNSILKLNKDPTNNFQKKIIETLKQCQLIINKNQIKHLIQRKPQAPTLKAQIKLHKIGTPIRPIVNKTLNKCIQQVLIKFNTMMHGTMKIKKKII